MKDYKGSELKHVNRNIILLISNLHINLSKYFNDNRFLMIIDYTNLNYSSIYLFSTDSLALKISGYYSTKNVLFHFLIVRVYIVVSLIYLIT